MGRDIKSTAMALKAIAHLVKKGFKFQLLENSILHKVGTRRVRGLALYHQARTSLESPLVAIHNQMCLDGGRKIHVATDNQIEDWSISSEEVSAIRQAAADSPYADPELRALLLEAAGLDDVPLDSRPFVRRPPT